MQGSVYDVYMREQDQCDELAGQVLKDDGAPKGCHVTCIIALG